VLTPLLTLADYFADLMASLYCEDVNSKRQKTHWAFTVLDECNDIETTPMEGAVVTLDGERAQIYVGPVEMANDDIKYPHRHCLLSFRGKFRACKKGKAVAMVREFIGNPEWAGYCQGLVQSRDKYLRYAWKSVDPARTAVETAIKRAIQDVVDEGHAPSNKRVKTQLVRSMGAKFAQREKETTNLMLQEIDIFQPGSKVPFQVNPAENRQSAFRTLNIMYRIIMNGIRKNGYTSTHNMLKDASDEEVVSLVMCLVTMPFFCMRGEWGDCLPGLYLYGSAQTGKSHLFKSAPYYAKIAQDAQGVSRFRLQGVQRAYLLDDIKAEFLDEPTNMGTIRQLVLGDSATVKIMGDTQEVAGWLVATSNETPTYLTDKEVNPWNVAAWKRRFIAIELTEPVDVDPIVVKWQHISAQEAAVFTFMCNYEKCSEPVRNALERYWDHQSGKHADDWDAPFGEMCDMETEWINENVPLMEKAEKTYSIFDKRTALTGIKPNASPEPLDPTPKKKKMDEDLPCPNECYCKKCVGTYVRIAPRINKI
jgi:hypothetical protein